MRPVMRILWRWLAGELVGGLLGVELGGLFCADSKFRRVTDASAAVAHLSRLHLRRPGWRPTAGGRSG